MLVLVLDDYHLVTSARVHASVATLLDRSPPQLHLMLITRAEGVAVPLVWPATSWRRSVKRVASAVGGGSVAIRLVHDYLALASSLRQASWSRGK